MISWTATVLGIGTYSNVPILIPCLKSLQKLLRLTCGRFCWEPNSCVFICAFRLDVISVIRIKTSTVYWRFASSRFSLGGVIIGSQPSPVVGSTSGIFRILALYRITLRGAAEISSSCSVVRSMSEVFMNLALGKFILRGAVERSSPSSVVGLMSGIF